MFALLDALNTPRKIVLNGVLPSEGERGAMSNVEYSHDDEVAPAGIDTFAKAVVRARLRATQLRRDGYEECASEIESAVRQWSAVLAALN